MTVKIQSGVTSFPHAVSVPDTVSPVISAAPVREATTSQSRPAVQAEGVRETLEVIARQMEEYLADSGRTLRFSVDDASGDVVLTVRDESGATIRQIPSEEALRLRQRLQAGTGGLLDMPA